VGRLGRAAFCMKYTTTVWLCVLGRHTMGLSTRALLPPTEEVIGRARPGMAWTWTWEWGWGWQGMEEACLSSMLWGHACRQESLGPLLNGNYYEAHDICGRDGMNRRNEVMASRTTTTPVLPYVPRLVREPVQVIFLTSAKWMAHSVSQWSQWMVE
jgi:hypothetical protein